MLRVDRLLLCSQCGIEYITTVEEQRQQIAASARIKPELVCLGCRVLNALTARHHGYIRWYDPHKGYGFIHEEDGSDVFLHASALRDKGHLHLHSGQVVTYRVEQTAKGPLATEVERAE